MSRAPHLLAPLMLPGLLLCSAVQAASITFSDFEDRGAASGAAAVGLDSNAACFGDLDNDGLLDVMIGNTFDTSTLQTFLPVDPFGFAEHNTLHRNEGNLR